MDKLKIVASFLFDFYAIRCEARAEAHEHRAANLRATCERAKVLSRSYFAEGFAGPKVAPVATRAS